MAATIARANQITLNKMNDLMFMGENVAVPLGCYATKDLAGVIDHLGAEIITVEFHTISDPKARARDIAKYTKRLASLGSTWQVGEWRNKVVRGFVFPDVLSCEIRRA